MVKTWLVFCPHCGKGATNAEPPNSVAFTELVSCVLCNRTINAKKGAFNYYQKRIKKQRYDLLSVD